VSGVREDNGRETHQSENGNGIELNEFTMSQTFHHDARGIGVGRSLSSKMAQQLRGVDVDFECGGCKLKSDMKRAMRLGKKPRGWNGKYHIAEENSIRLYG